jgi:hypothetical protein
MTFKPYKGLSVGQLEQIKKGLPTLKKIQTITGVPWEAMAGIWFREGLHMSAPKTPGGPWQFDPVPSPGVLRGLLDRFTALSADEKAELVRYGVNNFYSGGVFAACLFRLKTGPRVFPGCPDSTIKDAMWGYNGRAKYHGSADGSPYVMNGYDEKHWHMRLIGSVPIKGGGRKRVDFPDERPGAFTVYKQLQGLGL